MKIRSYTKGLLLIGATVAIMSACSENKCASEEGMKDALKGSYLIGTALNTPQILGEDSLSLQVVTKHFNTVVAENCMKSEVIQPEEGKFDFTLSDKFVEFGEKNNMFVTGHTLVWHSQTPAWFFVDSLGNDVSRDVMIERLRTHISTVVGRYKGRVKGWDVVNETIMEDGTFRDSKLVQIIGEDFVKLAFQFAHDADPEAELYYNDYSMSIPAKRDGVIRMVKSLQEAGVRIDGIGMQAHSSITTPDMNEFEKSIVEFASLGVKVMITELDISVLPFPDLNVGADVAKSYEFKPELNPYPTELPDSISVQLNNRYVEFFKLFNKHQDKIGRVTVWGVNDSQTWRNYWPVAGRTDYPLLFDRNNKAKGAVQAIINLRKEL
ncbi:endo-1,4-beta-xylanase [Ancylomarina sp. 16SWW S1-10-2]|uniref:endo-1,4-beta-xylanase n=1 Tax=Ancylomarina sp. 16SWW S1-10-2 TaxID=2499681 RepID=UPI0012AEA611|nr:endo-1,4-beta-xylanase [Ancylomarina sp. 16SWW S1-10-2]MRT91616.1 endo-1,4-beta-xylanase [Ancylomarina sp. 16SWW S1-10-2]